MSATVLTVEAARAANIEVVDGEKYQQAVHDVVVALQAGRRSGSANSKTKAEVNLSGAKPWRQKGTGRARAGYKSSPVWRGGGVVFGPKPRDYAKRVNKKVKKVALRKALSERIKDGDVLMVESFAVAEPKTKQFVTLVRTFSEDARVLIVSSKFDEATLLAARNVQQTTLLTADRVNTEHLLKFKKIVMTNEALTTLAQRMALRK